MKRIFAFILCFAMLTFAFSAEKKSPESTQTSIIVSSYNMLYTFEKGHRSYTVEREQKWHKRKDTILQMVKSQNIDICGTQELRKLQIDYLFPDDTYNYVIAPKEFDPQQRLMNNLILYKKDKFEVLENGFFWLISYRKWRHCIWAKFKDKQTDCTFYVFNVHFPVTREAGEEGKMVASKTLVENIKKIANNQRIILTGDFNSLEITPQIKHIKQSGLVDSKEVSKTQPQGPNFSYNKYSKRYRPPAHPETKNLHIDFIFCSKDIEVESIKVVPDCINGVLPSDHFPVVAKLKIKK